MNQIHRAFDARPTTLTKIRAYLDMFGLKGFAEIFPFALNHCLWSGGFVPMRYGETADLGAEHIAEVAVPMPQRENPDDSADLAKFDFAHSDGIAYAKRFVALCRERGIAPVLVCIPFPLDHVWRTATVRCGEIVAAETGAPFLNLFAENIVDFDIDSADEASHLNAGGARKVTDWLGRYIHTYGGG